MADLLLAATVTELVAYELIKHPSFCFILIKMLRCYLCEKQSQEIFLKCTFPFIFVMDRGERESKESYGSFVVILSREANVEFKAGW